MSTNVASVISHFPDAENGFTTTTAGSVSSGATTVSLNSVAGYTNGEPAVFVIDPSDITKKQTFTGIVDTSGVQITSVVWTAGTNTTHALGATVVDYATATHIAMMSKGIKVAHNQDGTLKTGIVATGMLADSAVTAVKIADGVITPTKFTTDTKNGWTAITGSISAVTYNGNRSYSLTTSSDNTASISPGMRYRTTRTVAAPTQSTSLDGSTQYYSKSSPAGMTFTDDFVVSAWVKLSAYNASFDMGVVSRFNGTSGWIMSVTPTGQVYLSGYNGGSSNNSRVTSYQSVPLNKWVHITAQLDMSTFTATTTTSYIMIDGVDVPVTVSRGGSNPTALVQAGDLNIGTFNATLSDCFPGKIAQVAVYSAKVTQANIRATISQGLAGTETSLISAYSFNNSINDLNANANNLTANGSAVATNADSPFGGQASGTISSTLDYAIVQTVSASTLVVQVPEGCTIPTTGGVASASYSIQKAPYGFPVQRTKWRINSWLRTDNAVTSNSTYGAFLAGGWNLTVPIGEWVVGWQAGSHYNASTAAVFWNLSSTALTGLTTTTGYDASPFTQRIQSPSAAALTIAVRTEQPQSVSAAVAYVMYTLGATTSAGTSGNVAPTEIYAENAYL